MTSVGIMVKTIPPGFVISEEVGYVTGQILGVSGSRKLDQPDQEEDAIRPE
ncbi:hypothetical protein [Nocardia pseudovaccinii]|uniref:hypothetical protein n=1 Tax=Nocardia pseudovaccinii TaxID=189540 RepID=UPI000AE79BA2|nr:hypothetical protein [Nocardia pseudovaccinii]